MEPQHPIVTQTDSAQYIMQNFPQAATPAPTQPTSQEIPKGYSTPPPAPSMDADAALEELKRMKQQHLESLPEVTELLTTEARRHKVVKYGNTSIKVRAAIPYDVQKAAEETRKAAEEMDEKGDTSAEVEVRMYQMLASLCIEAPWNRWQTWALVNMESGSAPTKLRDILGVITNSEKQIVSFR